MTLPLLFVTAVALVDQKKQVLLTQRPSGKDMAGLWEFPGGKVDAGETPEAALIREIKEELNLSLSPESLIPFSFASHAYEKFHLFMPLYLCRVWEGAPQAQEQQALAWVPMNALPAYAMPPADVPLAQVLRNRL